MLIAELREFKNFVHDKLKNDDNKKYYKSEIEKLDDKEKADVLKIKLQRISLCTMIDLILQEYSINEFVELKALKKIKQKLKTKKFDFEITKHLIWKFRHAYEFKASVLHYHKRILMDDNIASMKITLKRSGDKIAKEIIEKSSLWVIPETNYKNDKKRIQRFVSQNAQKVLKRKMEKENITFSCENIPKFCSKNKANIQMDHMLSKLFLLKYVKNIASTIKGKKSKEIKLHVNDEVQKIIPYMIGVLVTSDENKKLAKKEKELLANEEEFNFNNIDDHLKELYREITILDADNDYEIFNWERDTLKVNYDISSINLEKTQS
jgi:hypothetical protein